MITNLNLLFNIWRIYRSWPIDLVQWGLP